MDGMETTNGKAGVSAGVGGVKCTEAGRMEEGSE